jgi:D-glycero-alpha-D-manno-heptose-7-phosphate kinase
VIVTRTPVRVSFLGGGTDYPEHFLKHGGQTLGVTIDKYSYVSVKRMAPLFDYSIRVGYSRTETVHDRDEIQHPSVRECLRFLDLHGPLEIHYIGDLPARTGLGSSSSFTIGLLNALHALKGETASQQQLAEEAVHVEREMIHENVGVQDQYTCALGGLRHLSFETSGLISGTNVDLGPVRMNELQSHLMLFHTGLVRHAHEVLVEQMENTRQGKVAVDLDVLSRLVDEGLDLLRSGRPIAQFGELLDAAWQAKQRLSSRVSNDGINELYRRARAAGAIGGKLLGAGGGGFFLLFVAPESRAAVLGSIGARGHIPISTETSGARLVYQEQ